MWPIFRRIYPNSMPLAVRRSPGADSANGRTATGCRLDAFRLKAAGALAESWAKALGR